MLQDQALTISDMSKSLAGAQDEADRSVSELNATVTKLRQQLALLAASQPPRHLSRLGLSSSWLDGELGAALDKGGAAEPKQGTGLEQVLGGGEPQQQLIAAHWVAESPAEEVVATGGKAAYAGLQVGVPAGFFVTVCSTLQCL